MGSKKIRQRNAFGNTSMDICLQSLLWCVLKCILKCVLKCVLKYMLKPTSGSASFENTVRDILAQQSLNSKPASACQRVLMRQITEHDMPRTEAARIVSGRPFVFYSRPFRMVNLMGVRGLVMPHEEQGGEVEVQGAGAGQVCHLPGGGSGGCIH